MARLGGILKNNLDFSLRALGSYGELQRRRGERVRLTLTIDLSGCCVDAERLLQELVSV